MLQDEMQFMRAGLTNDDIVTATHHAMFNRNDDSQRM